MQKKKYNKECYGFYKRLDTVLKIAQINDETKREYENTLQCMADFRNSFHSNGKHLIKRKNSSPEGKPKKGELDKIFSVVGFTIEFKHDEEVEYNWKSGYLLIRESVEVLKNVIVKEEIAELFG